MPSPHCSREVYRVNGYCSGHYVIWAILLCHGLAWAIYVVIVLVGLGYGAHWAIVPAAASELFGLKTFVALYNFLTLASPAGSLIFSGAIASGIYDYEAEKQTSLKRKILGPLMDDESSPVMVSYATPSLVLSCRDCVIAAVLSLIVVYWTKSVYAQLYGKSHA
ncbi:major facilitator superfamily protein [Actinidia rufa]|uniref:Major facilitator superfamily protein n=1 Tax=Actinidia rufa TaxID=165716 RepID=A0A7J0GB48_9ERIC|nr:major facilitator superfamily protein [Actinidia rufa]